MRRYAHIPETDVEEGSSQDTQDVWADRVRGPWTDQWRHREAAESRHDDDIEAFAREVEGNFEIELQRFEAMASWRALKRMGRMTSRPSVQNCRIGRRTVGGPRGQARRKPHPQARLSVSR